MLEQRGGLPMRMVKPVPGRVPSLNDTDGPVCSLFEATVGDIGRFVLVTIVLVMSPGIIMVLIITDTITSLLSLTITPLAVRRYSRRKPSIHSDWGKGAGFGPGLLGDIQRFGPNTNVEQFSPVGRVAIAVDHPVTEEIEDTAAEDTGCLARVLAMGCCRSCFCLPPPPVLES
jgi:hypothetical protein